MDREMKNLFVKNRALSQYQLLLFMMFILSSCQLLEVEENFLLKNENRTLPNLDIQFGESSDFNLSSEDGAFVDIIVESNQEYNDGVELYVSLNSVDGDVVLVKTIETVPTELVLKIEDLRQVFDDTELENGDLLFFSFQSTINGEAYQFNNAALSAGVICNSMISTADDTWTGNAFTDNGASFPSNASANDIKIIPLGDDNYLISDISAGWYEAINFQPIQEGIYNDNCNEITWVGPGENRQFNFVEPENEGSWDPQTGTLTIYWYDEGNDFNGKSVFTKNE
ncbi:MAG: hypothetical protein DSY77_10070 [Bacteroidetes bacterium]|nr:MAG: hypothetical protein DSY77_10070 [Bacteroidota bacterium]